MVKQWKVMEKGKKHTAEIIEADTSTDAKKMYRVKHNLDIKLSAMSANIKLGITQDQIDEVAQARQKKDDAVKKTMSISHEDMLKKMEK